MATVKISELSREERQRRWGWVTAERNGGEVAAMAAIMVEDGVGWAEASRRVRVRQQASAQEPADD